MAGFECSSHRRKDGVRLDLIRATSQSLHALGDYRGCAELGLRTIRATDCGGTLIETAPGTYDGQVGRREAARSAGVQVIWDIFAEVGLFSAIHADGTRRLRQPVADELVRQQDLFTANRTR